MLNSVKVQGFVTEDGRLELQLPPDAPRGAVEVFITAEARPVLGQDLTLQESRPLWKVQPLSGAELVALLQELGAGFTDVDDSAAYVEALRQARQVKNAW